MPSKEFKQQGIKAWCWCFIAYWRLWSVVIKLRFLSFDWLKPKLTLAQESADNSVLPMSGNVSLLALHEAVRLAARLHFVSAQCLPKSLVLASMLRRAGHDSRVVIGVAKSEDGLASHAWVEVLEQGQYAMLGEPEPVPSRFTKV